MPEVSDTDLALCYQAGDREAGGELLVRYEKSIRCAAKPFLRSNINFDDILQEARIGFLAGVAGFDPERRTKLITYCHRAARNACVEYLHNHSRAVRVPAYYQRDSVPSEARATDARRANRAIASLDAPIGDSDMALLDTLRSEAPTPADEVEALELSATNSRALHDAVGRLLPAQAKVIQMAWFGDSEPNLAAIGRGIGVTRARVQQIHAQALGNLRRALREVAA